MTRDITEAAKRLLYLRLGSGVRLRAVLFTVACLLLSSSVCYHETYPKTQPIRSGSPILIGAPAKRRTAECLARWKPTADYLERHLPAYEFEIVPIGFDEISNKVILVSGYSEMDVSSHFVGEMPSVFIQKPFKWDELNAKNCGILNSSTIKGGATSDSD